MSMDNIAKPAFLLKENHLTALFGATLFTSAALMFMLQPMVGKMLLPLVGGTPAGWVAAMAFFQIMLLIGYGLAHYLGTFSAKRHGLLFIFGLVLGGVFLPVLLPMQVEGPVNAWLVVRLLAVHAGIPFIALSAASSTLQRLFASTGHSSQQDPYFLYAASNLGSFAGLLLYPGAIEPALTLPEQAWGWTMIYGVLALLSAVCLTFAGDTAVTRPRPAAITTGWKTRGRWILFAFVPSSLMMGVTTHITTEILSVPMIWVLPLGLYLLTFVIAFARKNIVPLRPLQKLQPVTVSITIALIILAGSTMATSFAALLWHLFAFTTTALMCHCMLAASRPLNDERGLTEFYLMIAVGGALGGVLNAFIAPLVFDRLVEYPLVLIASCLLNPRIMRPCAFKYALYGLLAGACMMIYGIFLQQKIQTAETLNLMMIGIFVLATLHARAVVVGSAILAILTPLYISPIHPVLTERNFYGVIRVFDMTVRGDDPADKTEHNIRFFRHGSTTHGFQSLETDKMTMPTSYFGKQGPVGAIFDGLQPHKIAVMGLGAGTLACYATPQREFTFLELDPAVVKMAQEQFTFLEKCHGAKPHRLITGDGRLELSKLTSEKFDLIMLDAFSSDMVPVHLVSQEAIKIYLDHLEPHGVLAFNLSSRYIHLDNSLAAAAEAAARAQAAQDDAKKKKGR